MRVLSIGDNGDNHAVPVFTRTNSKNMPLVDNGCPVSTQDSVRRFERVLNKVKGKKVAFEIGITYHAHCPMLYRAAATYQALGENQAH